MLWTFSLEQAESYRCLREKQTKKAFELILDAAATRWQAAECGQMTRSNELAPVKRRSRDNDEPKLQFASATLTGKTLATGDAELQGSSFPEADDQLDNGAGVENQAAGEERPAGRRPRLLQLIRVHFETSRLIFFFRKVKDNLKGKTRSGCIKLAQEKPNQTNRKQSALIC